MEYSKDHPLAEKTKSGESGTWWHEGNKGPLVRIPFINQFGSMKFSKVRMDENMRPHLNDGIEIHFIESGKYDWVIEDRSIELLPDDLSVTAPWLWNGSPAGKMDMGQINWIIINPEDFSPSKPLNLGKWTKLSPGFQQELGKLIADEDGLVLKKAKTFKKYFTELKKELDEQEEGFEIIVANILENLLIDLYRHLSNRKQKIGEEDHFIDTLTQMILGDLTKKWIVEDIAVSFGMGKTKFTDEVKRLTGYPPNSFIINLKVDKAKELILGENEMELTDIAFTCGFSSLQHFTSTFSQRTGITPGKYQSQIRKKGKEA
ncbi:AraC family transcriptional regulator [Echinicola jeungdonensis]|uniref:Helix-turn-helix domain-containing protein n=1 Tax=Echinicola jeungdonensis TaxID=709343 RepID=A0ABV5J6Q3_9BACT|nr:AraC family transcriptional regulator [Echinicola jeungdonensis]MDN3669540.1 AraC family transcriptional regulator [Echinicola jeungdonensis]